MGLIGQVHASSEGAIDIESDGRTYTGNRDVPGQACIYIRPGNTRNEAYRLSTFRRFPTSTSPVLPAPLARSGFFYTGYKDRVKCFSCWIRIENWVQGDDVSDKKWHRTDCEFANGRDTTNIPLMAVYKKELEKRWPVRNGFHTPHGATNMISQASPTQVSNNGVNRGASGSNQNIPTPVQAQSAEPRSTSPTTQQNQDRYSCLHPVNPHMRSAVSRLKSFKERNDIRWPRERLRAGIDDLANAGFFYLGDRDRVKCWYCNGGLQNWDYDDDPWTEHAKWFPSCQYLLQVKGHCFVDGVIAQYPDLQRPIPTVIPSPLSPPRGGGIPSSHDGDKSPPSTSNPLTQHRDDHSHVAPCQASELLQQECFKDRNASKYPNKILTPGINNFVNANLFRTDETGYVKCHCRNGGLQNWGSGVGPCTCTVIVENCVLESFMSNKKRLSKDVELASLLLAIPVCKESPERDLLGQNSFNTLHSAANMMSQASLNRVVCSRGNQLQGNLSSPGSSPCQNVFGAQIIQQPWKPRFFVLQNPFCNPRLYPIINPFIIPTVPVLENFVRQNWFSFKPIAGIYDVVNDCFLHLGGWNFMECWFCKWGICQTHRTNDKNILQNGKKFPPP